ncbi:MAG TPA: DsbA family protein [Gammaproteobacteria bacterium]|nr:DsbA family protein [Gammaproteobacteria bacterium]
MKLSRIVSSLAAAILIVVNLTAQAADLSVDQKKQVQDVVRNYLTQNPDVIIQALQVYQQKQMDQAKKTIQKTQDSSPQYVDALFHQPNDPFAGNPNGKITVVEFFDYQCPHCVEMTPVVEGLIKNNPDVKIVFKEFPIRGPMSELATRAALAAKQQGKYFEMHKGLMGVKQEPLTEDAIYKIAQSVGLDLDKLKAAMRSDDVDQQVKANYRLAQQLELLGTPALFIAKSDVKKGSPATAILFIPGQVDSNQMNLAINKISK